MTAGIREATDGLKTELRGQITRAGLGTRLANTWRGEVYPRGQPSIGAAGYVWSKAPGIIRLYAEGAVIRSKEGLFLAIPTPAATTRRSRAMPPTPHRSAGELKIHHHVPRIPPSPSSACLPGQ